MRNRAETRGRQRLGLALLLLGILFGCANSRPSRFYVLTPQTDSAKAEGATPLRARLLVAVGPVEFPGYLDRPQIVTRVGPNQLELAEFDRWAESLKLGFSGVLVDNLSRRLADMSIAVVRWETSVASSEYQVAVRVERFDRGADQHVVLDVRWAVLGESRNERGRRDAVGEVRWRYRDPQPSPSFDEMAEAMSRAVAVLAKSIEAKIRSGAVK